MQMRFSSVNDFENYNLKNLLVEWTCWRFRKREFSETSVYLWVWTDRATDRIAFYVKAIKMPC